MIDLNILYAIEGGSKIEKSFLIEIHIKLYKLKIFGNRTFAQLAHRNLLIFPVFSNHNY